MRSIFQHRGKLIFLLTFAASSWGVTAHPHAMADDRWADKFPNIMLRTQDNEDVRFYDDLIKGKTAIINLMYTRCDGELCDRGTKNLVQVQKALGDRLGKDVFIYSITLDPEHDTPEVLKAYAERYGAKPGWTFLTAATDGVGAKNELIASVRKSLGLTTLDPESRQRIGLSNQDLDADALQKQHSGMVYIVNDASKRWSKARILSRPDEILQVIERIKPQARPKG